MRHRCPQTIQNVNFEKSKQHIHLNLYISILRYRGLAWNKNKNTNCQLLIIKCDARV